MREYVVLPIKKLSLAIQDLSRFLSWCELLKKPLIPVVVTEDSYYNGCLAVYFEVDDDHIYGLCDYPSLTSDVRIAFQTDIRGHVVTHLVPGNNHEENTRSVLEVVEKLCMQGNTLTNTKEKRMDLLMLGVAEGIKYYIFELSKKKGFIAGKRPSIYHDPLIVLSRWGILGRADEIDRIRREKLRHALNSKWSKLSLVTKDARATRPNDNEKASKLHPLPKSREFDARQNPFAWSDQGPFVSIW